MVWAKRILCVTVVAWAAMVVAGAGQVDAQTDDPFGDVATEAEENPFGEDPFGESSDNSFADRPRHKPTAAATRSAASLPRDAQSAKELGIYSVDACSRMELRIRRALKRPISVSFDGEVLAEVVEVLVDKLDVPVFVDKKALMETGMDPLSDTVDQFAISEVSCHTAMRLLLRNLDLRMLIRDDVLWITTEEVAEEVMITRVYRLNPSWDVTDDQILNAIHSVVAPDSWENVGGPGAIAVVGGGLVVRNAFQVHEDIDKLFAKFDRLYAKAVGTHGSS